MFTSPTDYVDYTIVIEEIDDTPYLEVLYGKDKYVFNQQMDGGINAEMGSYGVSKLYMYLGEVSDTVTQITVNMRALINQGYDHEMNKIEDFSTLNLPVLTNVFGEKYCLIYGEMFGEIIPVYMYLYDEPTTTNLFEVAIGDKVFAFTDEYEQIAENQYAFGDFKCLGDPSTIEPNTNQMLTLTAMINIADMGDFILGADATVESFIKSYSDAIAFSYNGVTDINPLYLNAGEIKNVGLQVVNMAIDPSYARFVVGPPLQMAVSSSLAPLTLPAALMKLSLITSLTANGTLFSLT